MLLLLRDEGGRVNEKRWQRRRYSVQADLARRLLVDTIMRRGPRRLLPAREERAADRSGAWPMYSPGGIWCQEVCA